MLLRKSLFGVFGTILACGMIAFAQEPQSQTAPTQDGTLRKDRVERLERHRERIGRRERAGQKGMGRRGGMGHFMHQLNLSEEQRQQSRAIMQRRLEGTKSQREELFRLREKRISGSFTAEDGERAKALHQEIRTSMEGTGAEMSGLLTAEQKTRLEELQKDRKARMEQRLKERRERLQQRLNNKPL